MNRTVKTVLVSLLILAINAGLIYIYVFFALLKIAYEPIIVKANYYELFVFTFGVLIIELGIFFLVRKSKKILAKSLLIALSPFYFLIVTGGIDFIQFLNPMEFNETVWNEEISKPTEMARSLLWENELNEMSKEEVLQKLGKDYIDEYSDNSKITYRLTASSFAYFVIDFNNSEKVNEVYFTYWDD